VIAASRGALDPRGLRRIVERRISDPRSQQRRHRAGRDLSEAVSVLVTRLARSTAMVSARRTSDRRRSERFEVSAVGPQLKVSG